MSFRQRRNEWSRQNAPDWRPQKAFSSGASAVAGLLVALLTHQGSLNVFLISLGAGVLGWAIAALGQFVYNWLWVAPKALHDQDQATISNLRAGLSAANIPALPPPRARAPSRPLGTLELIDWTPEEVMGECFGNNRSTVEAQRIFHQRFLDKAVECSLTINDVHPSLFFGQLAVPWESRIQVEFNQHILVAPVIPYRCGDTVHAKLRLDYIARDVLGATAVSFN